MAGCLAVRIALVLVTCSVAVVVTACGASRASTSNKTGQPYNPCNNPTELQRVQELVASRKGVQPNSTEYTVGSGDLLTVTIYNYRPEGGDFNTEVRVDDRGFVSLPMLDPVHIGGQSLGQARRLLSTKLREEGVLNDPLVGLFLREYHGQEVIVLGAVGRPGPYPLSRGRHSLVDLISQAGGLSQTGGNYVLVRPAGKDGAGIDGVDPVTDTLKDTGQLDAFSDAETVPICFESPNGDTNPAFARLALLAGDLIVVPDAGQAFVDGEVDKPGTYTLTRGMTLTQLMVAAGGFRFPANREKVELVRALASGRTGSWEIDTDRIAAHEEPDILLQRNDRVYIPYTAVKKVGYGFYTVAVSVVRFSIGGAATVF